MNTKPGQSPLIGPAAPIAARLVKHTQKIRSKSSAPVRIILHGPPGTGKTTIAKLIAAQLSAHSIDCESINGRNLTIDVVREWSQAAAYGSLFGGWKVKIINEADLVPVVAQDLMLTYLDELPPQSAVIATSNASHDTLTERFATRFAPVHVGAPASEEIAALLVKSHRISRASANMIAAGCCGNVRDALLQAGNFAVVGPEFTTRPAKAPVKTVCAAKSESAKRAWETMRTKGTEVAA